MNIIIEISGKKFLLPTNTSLEDAKAIVELLCRSQSIDHTADWTGYKCIDNIGSVSLTMNDRPLVVDDVVAPKKSLKKVA